ncbi:MAG: hypothetical protein HDS55_03525 [Barnesiella sp.]|nr:hypothetical protein [Barnesiella sp.]
MSLYDIVQWFTVGVIVALSAVYLYSRIRSDVREGGCGSCELKDNCNKKKNKHNKEKA